MEELLKTSRITIAAVLIACVLIIGFLAFNRPLSYRLSAEDMAYDLMMATQLTPEEALELSYDSTVVFIDIRNYDEYQTDHLENAINIPIGDLLDDKNLARFDEWKNDTVQVVVYGRDEQQVTAPWMLLYQLGYSNTQLILGGMDYINKLYTGDLSEDESYNSEAPIYDYAGIIEAASIGQSENLVNQPRKIVPLARKKKKAAEGGC